MEKTPPSDLPQDLVAQIAAAAIAEQRRARRWGILFKTLGFLYLFSLLGIYLSSSASLTPGSSGKHTALIEVNGIIAADRPASAENVIEGLHAAYENANTQAIILRINSPGGSPVQSGYINDEITRLRELHADIPVYAVITDLCASGGYFVAAAADQIYADKASLIGSIGAVFESFGVSGTLEKLGVERRLLTAGAQKGFLDPFSPLNPVHAEHMRGLLEGVHEQFINTVKRGRGDRLSDDPQLFSGLIWTGEQSLEMGLIDAFGNARQVAREIVGAEQIVNYSKQGHVFERLLGRMGTRLEAALGFRLR